MRLDRERRARYNGCTVLITLVDTRQPPDDEGGGRSREPWLVSLLAWFLPWPALILWLCAASRVIDGWVGVACVFVAIGLATWRGLAALPTEGLNQTRQ